MKCLKKLVAVTAVLLAGCFAAFADSSDYESFDVECVGNMTRKEFSQELDDMGDSGVRKMLEETLEDEEIDISIKKFKLLSTKDVTDEIEQMHIAIEDEIPSNVKKNDVFVSFIVNELDYDDYSMDGWFVFSHYISEDDIYSYIYYYKVVFDY